MYYLVMFADCAGKSPIILHVYSFDWDLCAINPSLVACPSSMSQEVLDGRQPSSSIALRYSYGLPNLALLNLIGFKNQPHRGSMISSYIVYTKLSNKRKQHLVTVRSRPPELVPGHIGM